MIPRLVRDGTYYLPSMSLVDDGDPDSLSWIPSLCKTCPGLRTLSLDQPLHSNRVTYRLFKYLHVWSWPSCHPRTVLSDPLMSDSTATLSDLSVDDSVGFLSNLTVDHVWPIFRRVFQRWFSHPSLVVTYRTCVWCPVSTDPLSSFHVVWPFFSGKEDGTGTSWEMTVLHCFNRYHFINFRWMSWYFVRFPPT